MKPSTYYKKRRPEYFSDSATIIEPNIPKEVLAFELSKISTNQKQDEFENLCRRLSEKYIAPNLIPQVGPTGGGDGKTDYETYPVSNVISERWFVPENGWERNEKWAFAISAKEKWKPKVKRDVKKIIETGREYSKVYFISNQLISSKKKKDTQDELKKEFSVEVIILDAEWILEKIYSNKDFDIVIDSLNLSNSYRKENVAYGPNDSIRQKCLIDLEAKLSNSNRYLEYDFQLIEDALESAKLSRMLEMGRDEIEGKFDRVHRFCKKLDLGKYYIKYHYQRAWTYLYWFDDYSLFIEQYFELKKYISEESNIDEVESYFNLFNSLIGLIYMDNINADEYNIDINVERSEILSLLEKIGSNHEKVNSSLISETYRILILINKSLLERDNPTDNINKLLSVFSRSEGLLDFPFDSFKQIVEELGHVITNIPSFDDLIDKIAFLSEKRNSELSAGEMFLRRGGQKLQADMFKESIIYFGKAVHKLAKEETQYGMCLSLLGLGISYSDLGLHWAAYNSFVSACSLSFKSISEDGGLKEKTFQCIIEIIKNELKVGRIPHLFSWYEMLVILFQAYNKDYSEYKINDIPFLQFADSCLSVRLLNTENIKHEYLTYLPRILDKLDLQISYISTLYILGYTEEIDLNIVGLDVNTNLDDFFFKIYEQPFRDQIAYPTNPIFESDIDLSTNILGCHIIVKICKLLNSLMIAETLLSYLEGFFSTSLNDLMAHTEEILIIIVERENKQTYHFQKEESKNQYTVYINKNLDDIEDKNNRSECLLKLIATIMSNHFTGKDIKAYLTNLYEKEEVQERVSMIHGHRMFVSNILGEKPKLFLDNWIESNESNKKESKRDNHSLFISEEKQHRKDWDFDLDKVRHNEVQTHSIINVPLWDKAKWSGFGVVFHPTIGLGIAICFAKIDFGIQIFDEWKSNLGDTDLNNKIKITIIKGINKDHPFWYRVHINTNITHKKEKAFDKLLFITSRIHEMNAESDKNINLIESMLRKYGSYKLFPAKMLEDGKNMEPLLNQYIKKTKIEFRYAWEIGKNDLDSVVIREDDQPVIPKEIKDPPVLQLLGKK